MKRPIQIAASVYSVAAFAYIVYSNETQTGICGYLAALQLKWSGTASGNITMIAAILIFALPLFAAEPALMELGIPQVQDKFIYLPVTYPAFPRSWKTVFAITAVPLAATAAVYLVMHSGASQNHTLYKLDLDHSPASLPGAAKFVKVHGLLQRQFASGLKERNATDIYAPITGSAWTQDQPVKYFVHHSFYGDALPSFFRERGPVPIDGKTGGALPVFVKNQYTSQGLKIEPKYLIVNWIDLNDGKIPASHDHLIALLAGGLVTLVTFAVSAMLRVKPGADAIAEAPILREWIDKGRTLCFRAPDGEEIRVALSRQIQSGAPLRFAGKGHRGGDLYLHLRIST